MGYGLLLRVTHTGKSGDSVHVSDIRDGVDVLGGAFGFRKAGPVYIPHPSKGGVALLVYAGDVAVSFETGGIRQFIQGGYLTAVFEAGSAFTVLLPAIYDEGILRTPTPSSINFVGAGVTATAVGNDVTVTIPGGGGGGDHAALINLPWLSSGHTGAANTLAAFNGLGATTTLSTTVSGDVSGTLPGPLTVTDLTMAGEVQGNVLYFNGSNWVVLPPGTSGQFLQTQGGGANPIWATSGGGTTDHVLLSNLGWTVSGHTGTAGSLATFNGVGAASVVTGAAHGDVLYFNGTVWSRLAPGTSGHVLQTNGSGFAPTWVAQTGGTTNHAALTNLAWTLSGHTGTLNTLAAFNGAGAAVHISTTVSGDVSGTLPGPLTVTDLTITGEVQGSVLYYNGSNWVQLSPGTSGQFLRTNGVSSNPSWATPASGSVTGPGSSTDNALVRWDGLTGTIIQNSVAILDDSGNLTGLVNLTATGTVTFTAGALLLPQTPSPSQTTEGSIVWDTNDDLLTVGTGSGMKVLVDLDNSQTLSNKTLITPTIASFVNAQHNHQNAAGGGQLDHGLALTAASLLDDDHPQYALLTGNAARNTITGTFDFGSSGALLLPRATTATQTAEGSIFWDTNDDQLSIGTGTGRVNIIGDNTVAGGDLSGYYPNPQVIDLTITGEVKGSVLYFNGANWVQLAPGTSGYVLTTNGAGADPSWTSSGGGVTSHSALTAPSLVWTASGHTGTSNRIAIFDGSGSASYISLSASGDLSGTYPSPAVVDLTITGEVQGSILYYNGTNWVQLAPGTSGQFLRTSGPSANPVWATAAGSGNVTGPGSSTDNALVRWDGATGTLIQNSNAILSDAGSLSLAGGQTLSTDNIVEATASNGVVVNTVRNYGKSATNPAAPAPADGDIYYNTALRMQMVYDGLRSKWLSVESCEFHFGRDGATAAAQYYRAADGRVMSSTLGWYAIRSGTVVSIGYTRTDSDAATFEIVADGTNVVTVASTATGGRDITLNGDFTFGQVLAARNAAGGNATSDVIAYIRVKWRV